MPYGLTNCNSNDKKQLFYVENKSNLNMAIKDPTTNTVIGNWTKRVFSNVIYK
jgi:hypothetical protein